MGIFLSKRRVAFNLGDRDDEPVKGSGARILNIARNNFRGLIGIFVPLFILPCFGSKGAHHVTVQCTWFWIFWSFLFQPVNVPVAGLIPIFVFPLTGVMSSTETCLSYFNDYVVLFIVGGWFSLVLNYSEFDRRVILWFLNSKDVKQYSVKCLLVKASMATYIMSMISNRLQVVEKTMQSITTAFNSLQETTKNGLVETHFNQVSYIIKNAVHTSSTIGASGIVHSSFATLSFLALWREIDDSNEIFNYLQYSFYAIPTSLLMFTLNLTYHVLLIKRIDKHVGADDVRIIRKFLRKLKKTIPKKITPLEKVSIGLTATAFVFFFCRWTEWFGWAYFRNKSFVKDAVIACLFAIVAQILPKDWIYLKCLTAKNKREFAQHKPEVSMVQFRFVNAKTNYGYIYMLGCGIALYKAAKKSGADLLIEKYSGILYSSPPWMASLFLVCLSSVILTNAMTGAAALAIFLPFVMLSDLEHPHLAALGVGIGCSLGFMWPFPYTPAYYGHHVGKIPISTMAKYSIVSVLICLVVLWLSLCFWAPLVLTSPSTNILNSTYILLR